MSRGVEGGDVFSRNPAPPSGRGLWAARVVKQQRIPVRVERFTGRPFLEREDLTPTMTGARIRPRPPYMVVLDLGVPAEWVRLNLISAP